MFVTVGFYIPTVIKSLWHRVVCSPLAWSVMIKQYYRKRVCVIMIINSDAVRNEPKASSASITEVPKTEMLSGSEWVAMGYCGLLSNLPLD